MVELPDSFRGMGAWSNSTETQQSGHAPRSGPKVKNVSSAKDGAPERLGCGTVKEVSQILHQCFAASTWWCGSRPSIREVGQNGKTTTPRAPTIRSSPIVYNLPVCVLPGSFRGMGAFYFKTEIEETSLIQHR